MRREERLAAGRGRVAIVGLLLLLTPVLVARMVADCADIIEFRGPKPTEIVEDAAGPVPVIVIVDNAEIRSAPGSMWGAIGNAKWLDQWWITRRLKGDDGAPYVLAAKKDDEWTPSEFVGWLKEEDCLLSTEALRSEEEHGIYKKAVIVTKWRPTKGGTEIAAANCYTGPGPAGRYSQTIPLTLFHLYYVFAVRAGDGGKYYLLGDGPLIQSPPPRPERVLVGWAHEGRVQEWNTRQALEYNKDNIQERVSEKDREAGIGGARIFLTKEEAEKAARGEQVTPVAEEDASTGAWEPYLMRYPLLEVETGETVDMRFFHVGYIGDKVSFEGEPIVRGPEIQVDQEKLRKIQERFSKVDVLFVIDSTGSMRVYFEPVAEAVKTIMDIIQSEYPGGLRPDFRFSVTFYRDYCDADKRPQPDDTYLVKRLPLTDNVQAIRDFLEKEVIPRDAGGDEPEAVFHGISHAITEAKKGELRDGLRLLILMGDKGNHEDDPRKLNTRSIAGLLAENDFDFFAMHAFEPDRLGNDPDAKRFRDQMNEIASRLSGEPSGGARGAAEVAWRPFAKYVVKGDPTEVAGQLLQALKGKEEDAEKGARLASDAAKGVTLEILESKYGTRLVSRFLEMMRAEGVNPNDIFGKGVQIFDDGWIAERELPGKPVQIKEMLLVGMWEIGQLYGILSGFAGAPPSGPKIREVWTATLKKQLGEDVDTNKTVEELIRNRLGLPVRRKLLQKTVQEVANMPTEELVKAYHQLVKDAWGLQAILAERRLEELTDDSGNTIFKLGEEHPYFFTSGNLRFAWIPLEKMP